MNKKIKYQQISGRLEQVLFWVLIIFFTLLLIHGDWLSRWDLLIYDAQIKLWHDPPPSEIIIIAIDESSIKKLGRWPWPRSIHAQLLNKLTTEEAGAIGMDIILSEPSRNSVQDNELADAIKRNGKVVLPVLAEQTRVQGQLVETLPLSLFAEVAAAMGHVHVELDKDGIARSVFLLEGLGTPHWPSFALSVLNVAMPDLRIDLPGTQSIVKSEPSPYVWSRNYKMLIPFAGPPGHFNTLSYANALGGNHLPGLFKNKIVLIGATATGLGDALPTPVSAEAHSMSGVEINANILNALIKNVDIRKISVSAQMTIASILILLMAFFFTQLSPRWNLIITLTMIILSLLLSVLLLKYFYLWYAPSAILLAMIVAYPLWSWRRLENAMRFLDQELAVLHTEEQSAPKSQALELRSVMEYFNKLLPISGWAIFGKNGQICYSDKDYPSRVPDIKVPDSQWLNYKDDYWLDMSHDTGPGLVAIRWTHDKAPTQQERALLDDLLERHKSHINQTRMNSVDLVENRIAQVRLAAERMRALRRFISEAISQMGDGVLVVGPIGDIILSNENAASYLGYQSVDELNRNSLLPVLDRLHKYSTVTWESVLYDVLLKHQTVQSEAIHNGYDLLVQFAPLDRHNRELGGMIVNLTDITDLKTSERRRGELLGFLSHDLRAPLVSLMALLEISRTDTSISSLASLLDRMEAYAQNTLNLADQFLQLSRAESGESINFQECDLNTISLNALEQVWAQARRKNIELKYKECSEEAWIYADPDLIERTIVNLLTNAVKYSNSATIISITIYDSNKCYNCCVCDQGSGISEEDVPHLFDRFYRVKQTSKMQVKGAGLGLAFVKTVIERHAGNVDVKSKPGKGSTFCISLPKKGNGPT